MLPLQIYTFAHKLRSPSKATCIFIYSNSLHTYAVHLASTGGQTQGFWGMGTNYSCDF